VIPSAKPAIPSANTVAIDEHAHATLRYIRASIDGAASLAVSGSAGIVIGLVGLCAALLSATVSARMHWLGIWLLSAPIAIVLGGTVMARQWYVQGRTLFGAPVRKFVLCLAPSVIAGALLTAVDLTDGHVHAIAGTWLLLYGSAVLAASAVTIRPLCWLGALFLFLGTIALLAPVSAQNLLLGAGFGGLHLLFGVYLMGRGSHGR
jgi:hypothetical protein